MSRPSASRDAVPLVWGPPRDRIIERLASPTTGKTASGDSGARGGYSVHKIEVTVNFYWRPPGLPLCPGLYWVALPNDSWIVTATKNA